MQLSLAIFLHFSRGQILGIFAPPFHVNDQTFLPCFPKKKKGGKLYLLPGKIEGVAVANITEDVCRGISVFNIRTIK